MNPMSPEWIAALGIVTAALVTAGGSVAVAIIQARVLERRYEYENNPPRRRHDDPPDTEPEE